MEHERRHGRNGQEAVTNSIQHALNQESSGTHNVIGVVVKISIDTLNSKAQVLVADTTIEENAYARVSLQGTDTVTASLAEVSVGDVISFHGFRVTKHNANKLPLVADFYEYFQEPEAGWTRLHRNYEHVSCQDQSTSARVQELVEWFATTKFNNSIPSLPCRRRRLNELHTAGITTHVVARVASVDTAASAPPSGSRKQKRWLPLKKRRTTIAVLLDGNDVMPLLDCSTHEATLKQAIQSEKEVLLTNVVTCGSEEKSSRDVIVLRPTDSTSIIPMIDDSTGTSQRQSASHSNTCRETQCLSLTQDMPGASKTETLASPLRDVYIDELNVSLGDGNRFVSPNGFVNTIIDNSGGSPRYREATLTLDGAVVKADSAMMQTLCGSIDPESLLQNGRLRTHVTDLMHGLLEEPVSLTWTLERNGDTRHATRCFLPRL